MKKKANTNHIAHQVNVTGVGIHKSKHKELIEKEIDKEIDDMNIDVVLTKLTLFDVLELMSEDEYIVLVDDLDTEIVSAHVWEIYETDLTELFVYQLTVEDNDFIIGVSIESEFREEVYENVLGIKQRRGEWYVWR